MSVLKASVAVLVSAATLACGLEPAASASGGVRLVIPKLHLDAAVGTTLALGPAFYPGSGQPGEPYTIGIAGHRTTHTHPFWSLDALRRGDRITLISSGVRHDYRVTGSEVVAPDDWNVARDTGRERLILSTCTPRFSAAHRLVVFATPVARADLRG